MVNYNESASLDKPKIHVRSKRFGLLNYKSKSQLPKHPKSEKARYINYFPLVFK